MSQMKVIEFKIKTVGNELPVTEKSIPNTFQELDFECIALHGVLQSGLWITHILNDEALWTDSRSGYCTAAFYF